MSPTIWQQAATVDQSRRDRETSLIGAVRAAMNGELPDFDAIGDRDMCRRLAYLVDLGQTMRGQTDREAIRLGVLRHKLLPLEQTTFWPLENPLPAGTDPVAERWGFTRGCNTQRLRQALKAPLELLSEL